MISPDANIADSVSSLIIAPDPKACSKIFEEAIAPFDIDAFACGEVDLAELGRTDFYAITWPDDWRKFYMSSGTLERDPLLEALRYRL